MTHVVFAIPGDLSTRTGGYAYARALLGQLPEQGIAIRHCALAETFPQPSDADVATAMRALEATAKDDVLLVDGLAFGALPAGAIKMLARPIVALVHHPLGFETGLDEAARQKLIASERAALACADRIIVTSAVTRDVLVGHFDVAAPLVTIAEPGTRPVTSAHIDAPAGASIRILAVGSIVPRKGFDILIEALAGLRDLDWRLRLAGSRDRAPATARALRRQIAARGLADRIDLLGELDTAPLDEEYSRAALFVLSSHYEGYGMVLSEAMAHGLPIVTTTGGAAARTVPDEAALKVPPADARALGGALRRAIGDVELRRQLGLASHRAGVLLPRWPATAAKVAAVLRQAAEGARP